MRIEYREYLGLPIKTPMDYWIKYWEYYIERLEDDKERNVGLTGPRFILEALKEEVRFHNSTKHNKEYFKAQINYWKKSDAAFSKLFSKELNDLMQHHFNDDNKIQECCSNIIAMMNEGEYFDILIECLGDAITKTDKLSYDKKRVINQYIELIVSEFVASGFNMFDIKSLPKHLPTILCEEDGKIIIAPDKYMGIKREDFKNEEQYHLAVAICIKNRSLSERLSEIKQFFHEEKNNYTVIVEVKGFRGKIDCTFDDINIYSSLIKQYIKDKDDDWLETGGNAGERILAAIPVTNCIPDSAITIACNRLQKLLNLLTSYIEPTSSFSYIDEYILVLKEGIPVISKGIPINNKIHIKDWKKFCDYQLSTRPSEIIAKLEIINKMFSNNTNRDETFQTLSSARYWYVKARETSNGEDKLLFSWIAIEGIFSIDNTVIKKIIPSHNTTKNQNSSKIDLIAKITKAIIMKPMFYNEWLNYYYLFRDSLADDNFYDIPQDVISCTGLDAKEGEVISGAFINGLQKLEKSINDEVKKNEIHDLYSFYKNRTGFIERERQLENDILMVYYLRNMIVHNASFPQAIIDIYARKSLYVAGAIINTLQTGYAETLLSLNNLLIDISTTYDAFLLNFESELLKLKSRN